MKILQGFQIANSRGENIQGDDDCPFDLPSYAVMDCHGVQVAAQMLAADRRKVLFQPIYEDMIEAHVFVTANEVHDSYR